LEEAEVPVLQGSDVVVPLEEELPLEEEEVPTLTVTVPQEEEEVPAPLVVVPPEGRGCLASVDC
jgi:hypothetical protein